MPRGSPAPGGASPAGSYVDRDAFSAMSTAVDAVPVPFHMRHMPPGNELSAGCMLCDNVALPGVDNAWINIIRDTISKCRSTSEPAHLANVVIDTWDREIRPTARLRGRGDEVIEQPILERADVMNCILFHGDPAHAALVRARATLARVLYVMEEQQIFTLEGNNMAINTPALREYRATVSLLRSLRASDTTA